MSVNVTLEGRIGGDPEIRFTKDGKAVASFSMVTSKSTKQGEQWVESETTWYRVSAWDSLAENVTECLAKGDAVIVTGRVFMDSYTDKEGVEKQSLKVTAYNVGPALKRNQWKRGEAVQRTSAPVAADPWMTLEPKDDTPPF